MELFKKTCYISGRNFPSSKNKKAHSKKNLIFREMKLSCPKLKKLLYFRNFKVPSLKKNILFLIFLKNKLIICFLLFLKINLYIIHHNILHQILHNTNY